MVSKKSLSVFLAGLSVAFATALSAAQTMQEGRIYSPITAGIFHKVGRELASGAVDEDNSIARAMVFLNAAAKLDTRTDYLYEDLLLVGSQSAGAGDYAMVSRVLVEYADKTSNFDVVRKAVRFLLSSANSRQDRENLLLKLFADVREKNGALASELLTEYGRLAEEKADIETARNSYEQAYYYNNYNQLAKEGKALEPAVYAGHLRRAVDINPLSLDAAFAFAQYCERIGVYDVAAAAYEYTADLFEYLTPEKEMPASIYLPWALTSYNTPRLRAKCLDIAARIRRSGRFDIRIEALAGSAAREMGNKQLSEQIFDKAARRAAEMLGSGTTAPQVTALQLSWFHAFAPSNREEALAWANRAFSTDSDSPDAKAIFAYALTMQGQFDLAGEYIAGLDNNQIARLTKAVVQLSQGKKTEAIETLKSAVGMDPVSLAAQKAKALLAENGSAYIFPASPEVIRARLDKEFGDRVVSPFRPARDILSLKLNLAGSEFSYDSDIEAELVITNKSPNPIIISEDGMFKGNIRVDAVVRGDLTQTIERLVSTKAVPGLPVEPGHYASIPLDLMTGPLRRLLLAFPQASVEIEFTVYLDPVVDADGKPANTLKDIPPVRSVITRDGVNLTRQYLIQRLDTLAHGQEGQRGRAARLFAGLLAERDYMARSGAMYRYNRVERPILLDAVRRGLLDESWKVRIQTMDAVGLLPGPADYQLTRAVSASLSHEQWPARLMALYTLSNSPGEGFDKVLDWSAEHDSSTSVRAMAVALGAKATTNKPAAKTN